MHHLRVDGLRDDVPVVCDELHHLAERRALHFLPFQVAQRVGQEVEEDAALPQLLEEELLLLGRGNIYGEKTADNVIYTSEHTVYSLWTVTGMSRGRGTMRGVYGPSQRVRNLYIWQSHTINK